MRARLGDIAEIASGYPLQGALISDPAGSHWAVTARDIDGSFRLNPSSLVHATPDLDPQPYFVQEGDLLFLTRSRYGAAVIERLPGPTFAAGSVFILRVDHARVDSRYLAWYFALPRTQRELRRRENAGSMPFLRKAEIAEIEIPLPQLLTQRAIGEVAGLRHRERDLLARIETLRQQTVEDALLRVTTI
ncbi:MAG: hypothetical protein QOC81_557 [Thermoanaerobaculia bacterium]|jgi:restriction endonuclease S subunit|nr:hypothetical protein [Thermoanaerobaculia bacterium]